MDQSVICQLKNISTPSTKLCRSVSVFVTFWLQNKTFEADFFKAIHKRGVVCCIVQKKKLRKKLFLYTTGEIISCINPYFTAINLQLSSTCALSVYLMEISTLSYSTLSENDDLVRGKTQFLPLSGGSITALVLKVNIVVKEILL